MDIKDYDRLYFANELGEIFSYPKKTRKGIRKMKTSIAKNGYLTLDLCKNGQIKKHLVHRLIAKTFLDNPLNKSEVNHINGIKNDNKLSNLEWNTKSENQLHSIKIGLRSTIGEKNSQCKLTNDKVFNILNDNRHYKVICNDYKISLSTIYDIKKGRSWNHITELQNTKKSV